MYTLSWRQSFLLPLSAYTYKMLHFNNFNFDECPKSVQGLDSSNLIKHLWDLLEQQVQFMEVISHTLHNLMVFCKESNG